jgi:hypothetical protein
MGWLLIGLENSLTPPHFGSLAFGLDLASTRLASSRLLYLLYLTVYLLYTEYCWLAKARAKAASPHLPHGLRSLVPGSMRRCLTSLRHGAPPPTVTSPTDLSPPWCAPASCRLARSVPCCVARPSPPRRPPRAPQSPVRTQSDAIRRNQTQSDAIRRNQTQSDAIRRVARRWLTDDPRICSITWP